MSAALDMRRSENMRVVSQFVTTEHPFGRLRTLLEWGAGVSALCPLALCGPSKGGAGGECDDPSTTP